MKVESFSLAVLLFASVSTRTIPVPPVKAVSLSSKPSVTATSGNPSATVKAPSKPTVVIDGVTFPALNLTERELATEVYGLSPAIFDNLGKPAVWKSRAALAQAQVWKTRQLDVWAPYWIDSFYDAGDKRTFFQQLLDHPFIDIDPKNCQIESEYSQCNHGNFVKLDAKFSGTINNTQLNAYLFFQAVSNFQGTFHYTNLAFTDARSILNAQMSNFVEKLTADPPQAPPDHTLDIIFNVLNIALIVLPLTRIPSFAVSVATSVKVNKATTAITAKYASQLQSLGEKQDYINAAVKSALNDPVLKPALDGIKKAAETQNALYTALQSNIAKEIAGAAKTLSESGDKVKQQIINGMRDVDSFQKMARSMYALGSLYVDYKGGVTVSTKPSDVAAKVGDQLGSFQQQFGLLYKSIRDVNPAVPGGLLDFLREGSYLNTVEAEIQTQMSEKLVNYIYHWVVEKIYGVGNKEVVFFKKRFDSCADCNKVKQGIPGEICTPGIGGADFDYYLNNPQSCYYFYPTSMTQNTIHKLYVTPDYYSKYKSPWQLPGFPALAQNPTNYNLADIYWGSWRTSREAQKKDNSKIDLWQSPQSDFTVGPGQNTKSVPVSFPVLDPDDPIQRDKCEQAPVFSTIYYMLDDYFTFGLPSKYKYPKCSGEADYCNFWFWRLSDVRNRATDYSLHSYAEDYMYTYKRDGGLNKRPLSERFCIQYKLQ